MLLTKRTFISMLVGSTISLLVGKSWAKENNRDDLKSLTINRLDQINSKSLIITIKNQIDKILNSILFESNDDETRSIITTKINNYLAGLTERKCIHDYGIVCDLTNNPNSMITNGNLRADVVIKINKNKEFVYLPYLLSK